MIDDRGNSVMGRVMRLKGEIDITLLLVLVRVDHDVKRLRDELLLGIYIHTKATFSTMYTYSNFTFWARGGRSGVSSSLHPYWYLTY